MSDWMDHAISENKLNAKAAERIEPTKEWLDALIEGMLNDLGAKYGYHLEQRVIRQVALREFRDAILTLQSEETDTLREVLTPKKLDELITAMPVESFDPDWRRQRDFIYGAVKLAQAIIEQQSERVECDHCYPETVTNYPRAGVTSEVRIKFPHDVCPDCGQSLKGAGDK